METKKLLFGQRNGISVAKANISKRPTLEQANLESAKAEKNTKRQLATCWRKARLKKAGDHYCHAALLFHKAGDDESAKAALLNACECYKKKRAWYCAAKTLEQAMALAQEKNNIDNVAPLAWRTAALYTKAGQPDNAAQLLERAAKALEEKEPANCLMMLQKAADIVETENRPIQSACYVNKLLRMNMSHEDHLPEAAKNAQKLVELYQEADHKPSTGRSVLGLVLLLVALERYQEAEKVAREYGNYCTREQNTAIEQLLDGFEGDDAEMISLALKSGSMNGLDAEFKTIIDMLSPAIPTSSQNEEDITEEPPQTSQITGAEDEDKGPKEDNNQVCPRKSVDFDTTHQESENVVSNGTENNNNQDVAEAARDDDCFQDRMVKIDVNSEEVIQARKQKRPSLEKRATVAAFTFDKPKREPLSRTKTTITNREAYRPRFMPSLCIDVTNDNLEMHMAENLTPANAAGAYADVTGYEPVQPKYLGMTTDQFREYKRSKSSDDLDIQMDDDD